MKRMLLIITLICIVIVSNSYNFPSKRSGQKTPAYDYKTLELSKKDNKYIYIPLFLVM